MAGQGVSMPFQNEYASGESLLSYRDSDALRKFQAQIQDVQPEQVSPPSFQFHGMTGFLVELLQLMAQR